MTFEEFKTSLKQPQPPAALNQILNALWHDGKGNWEIAHSIVQDIHTSEASWVHAYLHRKEGDHGNASYWYHRANKPVAKHTLDQEWEDIVKEMLRI